MEVLTCFWVLRGFGHQRRYDQILGPLLGKNLTFK